jgi:hypothetical protein
MIFSQNHSLTSYRTSPYFYDRFEEQHSFITSARNVYQRAVEFYGDEDMDERLYIAFARFEEGQREARIENSTM